MSTNRTGCPARLCSVLLLGALVAFSACSKEKEPERQPEVRTANVVIERAMTAPDAPLRSIDGHTQFISDYKGKIVLLN
jgi:hypothetical protein